MKKSVIIGIVIVMILLIVIVGWFIMKKNTCSDVHPENCNRECSVDSDCKLDVCTCINKDEVYYFDSSIPTICNATGCKCINQSCTYE